MSNSLPAGDYSPFRMSFRDASDEVGFFGGYGELVTEEDYDAQRAAFVAFVTAVDGITIGQIVETEYAGILTVVNPIAVPTNPVAQRENKLLVRYYDAINFAKFTLSIPTINLTNLVFEADARDFVSKTLWVGGGTNMSTFVTAFQAFAKNPLTGNATVIKSLQFVGRNT